MKKKVLIISAVVVVVLVAILVIKPFGKKDAAYTFETVKVEKGKIANVVTATGTIEAVTSVEVGTQVSGIIDKIYVDFNHNVKKGQVLAQLDKKQLQAQWEQSESSLKLAEAQLAYQEATYKRLKALYEKKLIAQADYDQAVYNFESAKSSLTNARKTHERNKTNLDYATITSPIDGVVLNRAVEEGQTVAASFNTPTLFTIVNDLTQMEVEASVAEADIGKVKEGQRVDFTVDAYADKKFEGKVAEVRLQSTITNNVVMYSVILSAKNPDKKLMPGMTASATIYVEEKDSALMLAGKATRFTPDMAYMQKQMEKMMKNAPKGTMPQGAGAGSKAPGSFPAAGAGMPSGGFGASNGTMPKFPQGGFGGNFPEGFKMVWVKDDKGGIKPNPITAGIDNGTYVEVVKGLKEGDEVVISMSSGSKKKEAENQVRRGPFPF
ncbi:MAG: efflux RND transporter periplasmic adaptor subunit [Bacteroidales bacterium]